MYYIHFRGIVIERTTDSSLFPFLTLHIFLMFSMAYYQYILPEALTSALLISKL